MKDKNDPKHLIQTTHIAKVFADEASSTTALSDISLTIGRGEFVAIVGPSGSGKSTLLHILGLLDRQTAGQYTFAGEETTHYSDDRLAALRNRTIGFVFQSFNLLARTSVLENVALPLAYSSVPRKEWERRAKEKVEAVGLAHRMEHEPSELSGGEKQRVAIARALVLEPEIIFADEPTGNLDSASGRAIMEILEHLNDGEGKTVVLITHDLTLARRAKRIIAIRDGKIEWDGPSAKFTPSFA